MWPTPSHRRRRASPSSIVTHFGRHVLTLFGDDLADLRVEYQIALRLDELRCVLSPPCRCFRACDFKNFHRSDGSHRKAMGAISATSKGCP